MTARLRAAGNESSIPIVPATFGGLFREGGDSPKSLARQLNAESSVSRVAASANFEAIKAYIPPRTVIEEFGATRAPLRHADLVSKFDDKSDDA